MNIIALKNVCGVYIIRCVANSKVYVGSAKQIRKRLSKHRVDLNKGIHHSLRLQRAWNKYGGEAFTTEVIELCEEANRFEIEQKWIDKLKAANRKFGFNILPVAGSRKGKEVSVEARRKISIANKGRKATPEARKNLAAALKAYHSTPEGKARYKEAMKNRKKHTGKTAPGEGHHNSKEFHFVSPDGVFYKGKGIALFARQHGLCRTDMAKVAQGKLFHCKGWRLAENANTPFCEKSPHRGFRFRSPEGLIVEGKNISQFAKEHGLDKGAMANVRKGTANSYKGWTNADNPKKPRLVEYAFLSPDGVIHRGTNVYAFAREHNLEPANLYAVLSGKNYHTKGWRKAEI